MNKMTGHTERRSSGEIRRDVDRTRAHLEEMVDALEDRLTPGRIVDQLWGRVRQDTGERAREKFREAGKKLSPGASGEGESAAEAVDRTRYEIRRQTRRAQRGFSRVLEENPWPWAPSRSASVWRAESPPRARRRKTGPTSDASKREATHAGE